MTEQGNIWKWYDEYYRDVLLRGDTQRQQLQVLRHIIQNADSYQTYENILTPIEQGILLSKELDEPYWYVFFEYSRCHLLMNKYRIKEAVDIATRLIVEIRKPQYQGCTLLARCYVQLLSAYTSYDPVGYSQEIRDVIAYGEQHFRDDRVAYINLALHETELCIALEDWQAAKNSGVQYQARSNRGYHMVMSTILLSQIAYMLGDNNLLKAQVDMGSKLLREFPAPSLQEIIMIWEAIWLLRGGELTKARQVKSSSTAIRANAGTSSQAETLTALFYYQLHDPTAELEVLGQLDQFVHNYSPYFDCMRRLRAFYILKNQKRTSRWIYISLKYTGSSRLSKTISLLPFIPRLVITLVLGSALSIFKQPEQDAMENLKTAIEIMRKPDFYKERMTLIEQHSNYIP